MKRRRRRRKKAGLTKIVGLILGLLGTIIIIHTVPLYLWYAALSALVIITILILLF